MWECMMEFIESINWAVIAPILVIQFILLLVAVVDLVRIEKTKGIGCLKNSMNGILD
jgi:hypothetical protein